MSEFESMPKPEIIVPALEDVESYRRMQAAAWNDTYPNEAAGVSEAWVKDTTESWLTPDALELSRERVAAILENENQFLYVAKAEDKCVGMVNTTNIGGHQRLEALYVDKRYRGTGVAQTLLDQAFSHLDMNQPITLEVIAYNERAQRFYQKNGFAIVPGSEHYYKDIMPSLKMIRPGGELHEI